MGLVVSVLGSGWHLVCGCHEQSSIYAINCISNGGDNILIFNIMQPWAGVEWWLVFGVLVLALRAVGG